MLYPSLYIRDLFSSEHKQIDQRTTKLMTMHKALHPKDDIHRLYIYIEKREEEDLSASKKALTHRYNGSKITQKNTKEDWLQDWQYDRR